MVSVTPHEASAHRSTIGMPLFKAPPWLSGAAMAMFYLLAWLLRRTYSGLDDDAHLYAFQAIAQLHPDLGARDLFLAYGSQDQYTFFTPLYAWVISHIGLTLAEWSLTMAFHIWAAIAAWFIARRFTTYEYAWLVVGLVIMIPGLYGSRGVFEYGETFLTARLPAEALVLTGLALFLHGRTLWSFMAMVLATLMHPIIAAPGIGTLLLLSIPAQHRIRTILIGTAIAVVVLTATATNLLHLPLIDGEWMSVVRERSFFVFVDTWELADWDWAALVLITLTFAAFSFTTSARSLFATVALIGIAGLALATIASAIPVELLLQGQPWRSMWLATYIAVISAVPTLLHCWRTGIVARYSCLTLFAAWVFPTTWAFPGIVAAPLALCALALYLLRDRIPSAYIRYVRWFGMSVVILAAATAVLSVTALLQLHFTTNRESFAVERTRDLLALAFPGILAAWILWLVTIRSRLILAIAPLVVATIAVGTGARIYKPWSATAYEAAYASFAPWRAAIDHQRNVFWPGNPVGTWFLLESPSYLSTSQTAGVVFARETALEAKRRATVLTPFAGHPLFGISSGKRDAVTQLSPEVLRQICADPVLGYVVTTQAIDVPPKGRWAKANLYSCDIALGVPP